MQEKIITEENRIIRQYTLTIGNIYQVDKPYEDELYFLLNSTTAVGFKKDVLGMYRLDDSIRLRLIHMPRVWKIADKVNPFYIQGWYIQDKQLGYRIVPAVNTKDDSWGERFIKKNDLMDTIINLLDRQPYISIYVYGLGRFRRPDKNKEYHFERSEQGIQYGKEVIVQNIYDI